MNSSNMEGQMHYLGQILSYCKYGVCEALLEGLLIHLLSTTPGEASEISKMGRDGRQKKTWFLSKWKEDTHSFSADLPGLGQDEEAGEPKRSKAGLSGATGCWGHQSVDDSASTSFL
ncbi:unnamed protein product [Natator depressus]